MMAVMRWRPAISVLSWLLAACLLAASPLLYLVSGASDSATEAARVRLAAIPALIAWPLLVLAIGLARHRQGRAMTLGSAARSALLLPLFAGAVLALARHLASAPVIGGDGAWTLFWAAATVAWVVLSAVLGRRPSASH
jgi:hypothetical protein